MRRIDNIDTIITDNILPLSLMLLFYLHFRFQYTKRTDAEVTAVRIEVVQTAVRVDIANVVRVKKTVSRDRPMPRVEVRNDLTILAVFVASVERDEVLASAIFSHTVVGGQIALKLNEVIFVDGSQKTVGKVTVHIGIEAFSQ